MVHRGPDAAGLWLSDDQRVALAHRRLSIIDVSSAGNQPMGLPDGSAWISFNGEIYNYRELRSELEQQGYIFRTASDTEVLLVAYSRYGAAMVERLRGMFAFALWDARRGGMLLARDPFGIKPLYYADDGRRVVVASQVKAVRLAEGVSQTLSPAGLVSFLLWGSVTDPFTLFHDIRALPAGSTVWIDGSGAHQPQHYWRVGDVLQEGTVRRQAMAPSELTLSARRELLHEALRDSLSHHLVSDVPIAMFLSGGLDSAALVGLATELGSSEFRSLTLGFDMLRASSADEVPYAAQTAATYGASHDTRWIDANEFSRSREALLSAMDQPTIDGVNVYFVSQMAAMAGLKVALSGLGSDELLGGYSSFRQVPKMAKLFSPFNWSPAIGPIFRRFAAPAVKRLTSPKYAGIIEYGASVSDAYLLRRGLFMPWELPELLEPEIARDGWQQLEPRARLSGCIAGLGDVRSQMVALETSFYMRHQLLRDSDWAGMAHSLEIRVPFVDATLLSRIAPLLTDPHPLDKQDMISALRRPLPAAVVNRPKTGFEVPIREWLVRDDIVSAKKIGRGLRGWAEYVLGQQLGDHQLMRKFSNVIDSAVPA
jgi:asparagine synthase (glutamine-hydrolysing)